MKSTLILILVTLSSYAIGDPEIKGTPNEIREFIHPNDNIVNIVGHASKTTYSDKAIISLMVTTENAKLSESIDSNSKLRNKVIKKLVATGINPNQINSSKFSTSPQYGWFGKKPSSYKVVNRTKIGITDESQLKQIALVADLNEEIDLVGSIYEHTKEAEFKNIVKKEALDDVLKQKEFYEMSLGIKLIPVGFNDVRIFQGATQGALLLEQSVKLKRKQSKLESFSSSYGGQKSPTSFEEVKYEANITVSYKVGLNNK